MCQVFAQWATNENVSQPHSQSLPLVFLLLAVSRFSILQSTKKLGGRDLGTWVNLPCHLNSPMSPPADAPAKPMSKSSPVVSVAEGVRQGPEAARGSCGRTSTWDMEGCRSGGEGRGGEGREVYRYGYIIGNEH